MFPKDKRLARADFAAAERGARARSTHFSAASAKSARGYAVVVSKSVAKRSVDRHLVKRRALAALKTLQLPPSLVVYARAGAITLSAAEIKTELRELISRMA